MRPCDQAETILELTQSAKLSYSWDQLFGLLSYCAVYIKCLTDQQLKISGTCHNLHTWI